MRAALVVGVLLFGCGHERLVVPSREAPLQERKAAYEQLKPARVEQYQTIHAPRVTWPRSLILANGQSITEPVDLLQAVLPGSETAKQVEAYQTKNRIWHLLTPIAGYGFGAGGTLLTTGIVANFFGPPSMKDFAFWSTLTGVVIMLGVPIVSLVLGWAIVPDAEPERQAAWSAYDGDLKERLGVKPPPKEPLPMPEGWPDTPKEPPEPAKE